MSSSPSLRFGPLLLAAWVLLLAFVFANVEIQIEGPNGWAAALPTWRIDSHPLLDLFWGGRPLTGYHAWVFAFMALVFHLPAVMQGAWSLRLEARILGCLIAFWILEDFLWFILNPAYGFARFSPAHVPWHIHWFLGLPVDYWTFLAAGAALVAGSYLFRRQPQ